MDLSLILLTLIFVICIVALNSKIQRRKKYLESLGFPILPPFLCFGSPPFGWHKILVHQYYVEKHKEFGKTWTRYLGSLPTIVTIDPELIRCVMVKNFDHFVNTNGLEMPENKTTLEMSKGDTWRALRKALSPTFTSGKLKSMIRPMEDVADRMIEVLAKEVATNQVVNVKEVFQAYALDTIASCAFGINTNSQEDADNQVLNCGRQIFSTFTCKNWIMSGFVNLFLHFPSILKVPSLYPPAFEKLFAITKQIIAERRKTKIEVGDFIDRLKEILDHVEDPLTPDMIYAQGVLFFSAGFETTSNALSTFAYNLARHPEIQEQIYQEIQEVIGESDGQINHETIGQMHYLEASINENLRVFPPVSESNRFCTKDFNINGITIAKGTQFQFPIWASHHNEEFFPEPEEFRPERFLKEKADLIRPFTWRPFGGGNRSCIGQRFAISEIKICFAKLLNRFKLEMDPEWSGITFNKGSLASLHYDRIMIKFIDRNN